MDGVLTMPPADTQAILEAVRDVGARVDGLRLDVFRALAKHDERIRKLELAEEREQGAAEERERQQSNAMAISLSRRGWIGVALTTAGLLFGSISWLIGFLGGHP